MSFLGSKPSLQIFLLLSGSIHLSLFAFFVNSKPTPSSQSQTVDISFETRQTSLASQKIQSVLKEKKTQDPPANPAPSRAVDPSPVVEASSAHASEASEFSEASRSKAAASDATPAVSAQERYIAKLARQLNSKKKYPEMAKKLRQQGRVILHFRLSQDGSVIESGITNPSSYQLLNKSAQDLIQNLKGLEPFPHEIKKTTWLFTVPIDYQM